MVLVERRSVALAEPSVCRCTPRSLLDSDGSASGPPRVPGLDTILNNGVAALTAVDLVIALAFGCVLMYRDAREVGINPNPFIVGTVLTGSLGLLAYAATREFKLNKGRAGEPRLESGESPI